MRIDHAFKKAWKSLQATAAAPAQRRAEAPKPQTRPTTDAFTTTTASAATNTHFTQLQQPHRSAAPKFDHQTATRMVEALYRGALGRDLDPTGRDAWVPMVEQGRMAEVIEHVLGSSEFTEHEQKLSPKALSTSLYAGILGRAADPEGDAATQAATARGHLAHRVFDMLLSPEHKEVLIRAPSTPSVPTPPTVPSPSLPREPGAALATVPMRAEYAQIPVDTSSEKAAVLSAAKWVRENKPQFFNAGEDRQVAFEMMSWVVGALRAHGIDAHRVVNHPSHPIGTPQRYGSDALVTPSRTIYDVYVAWGEPGASTPSAQNQGPYAPGRLRD